MDYTSVAEARRPESIDRDVRVAGWVRTRRDSKGGFSFIELNDGSSLANLQIVADATLANYESESSTSPPAAASPSRAKSRPRPRKGQATEVQAATIIVHGWADPEAYPLQKKRHSFEFLRTIAHLRPRTNTFGAIARVRNCVCRSIHDFFQEEGFSTSTRRSSPPATAKGPARCSRSPRSTWPSSPRRQTRKVDFTQDFFDRPAYLTVSGQLEAEIFRLRAGQGLHLRSDLSRGKLEHLAAPGRVLDGRAGDGLLRTGRQHGLWPRGSLKRIFRDVLARLRRRTWSSSTSGSTTR